MDNSNNNTSNLLEQALYYAEKLGWSIIPVGKNKKSLIVWKKYQTEKASKEQIIEWFTKYPDANIGIVTGKISNLIVIDIDPRHGGGNEEFTEVKTVIARTGGGGWHYYFQYEDGIQNHAGIKPGIDVRGEGGYVVAPNSSHESGENYEWEVEPHE